MYLLKKDSKKFNDHEMGEKKSLLQILDQSKVDLIILLLGTLTVKVHIFWEGHTILQNLHLSFVLTCDAR